MSKSMVERYEQVLSQDPTSTVFVELAKAFIEKGEHARAIDVCQNGLTHHPKSVVGRVLWGKALIHMGKASEAMNQFDLAVNIDRDNPHAYNLIGEVLLRKGLFRSALPILRKAAVLQPNDGRVKQWLEQTKAALAGGPAPVLTDMTTVDQTSLDQVAAPPADDPGRTLAPADDEDDGQATVVTQAYVPTPAKADPQSDPHGRPTTEIPAAKPARPATASLAPVRARPANSAVPPPPPPPSVPPPPHDQDDPPTDVHRSVVGKLLDEPGSTMTGDSDPGLPTGLHDVGRSSPTQELRAPVPATAQAPAKAAAPTPPRTEESDPFAGVPKRTASSDIMPGLTSTFSALEDGAQASVAPPADPFASFGPTTSPGNVPVVKTNKNIPVLQPMPVARAGSNALGAEASAASEPTIIPSQDLLREARKAKPAGLLEDVLSEQSELPSEEMPMPPPSGPPPPGRGRVVSKSAPAAPVKRGLLDEIPDEVEQSAAIDMPPVELNTQTTEAIAKEYERELRAKLAATQQKKSFFQKYGLALALLLGALVIVGGLAGSFLYTRQKNSGKDLATALAEGHTFVNADTEESYRSALESLATAARMDSDAPEVWSLTALARAVLFADHGQKPEDKAEAVNALSHSGVRESFPSTALVVDWLVSGKNPQAKQALLTTTLENEKLKVELECEAGRVLLADKKSEEGLKRLTHAVEMLPSHVRTLVALGDYYLDFEDYEKAEQLLSGQAAQISPRHPARVLSLAQARLELNKDLADSLAEVEALPPAASLPAPLRARRALLIGRLLSAAGRHDDALKELGDAATAFPDQSFAFDIALGQSHRLAGHMEKAQRAYESALKRDPKSDEAKEGLARVMLARSREKDLVKDPRLATGGRKVSLVRGIAYARLGEIKSARAELMKTQVNGKYPAEAAIALAVAEAQEEGSEKSIAMLEKLASTNKRNKSTVQVALARIYLQKDALDKARAQLEEAAKDPADYEANALLGELLVKLELHELALEPLGRAVDRNASHAPARHLLVQTLLSLGRVADALKASQAGIDDNAASDDAQRDYAMALFFNGKPKDAEAAAVKALKTKANDVVLLRTRAKILFALADAKAGFKALEQANALDPKDPETFCEIGNAFVRAGNLDTAVQAFGAATRENGKSVCGRLGPFHARPFGGKQGIKDLRAIIATAQNSWDKALGLATVSRVEAAAGLLNEAKEDADKAAETLPNFAPAVFAQAQAAARAKDDAHAMELYAKVAELDGAWSEARLRWADLLRKTDVPKAIEQYEAFLALSQNEADVSRVKRDLPGLKKR